MALTFLVCPYEHSESAGRHKRRLPLPPEIGDDWVESEIEGDRAIVASDFDPKRLSVVVSEIDGAEILERPESLPPGKRPLEDLADHFETKNAIRRLADYLAQRSDKEGYIRLEGLPWPIAARVLVETGKLGKTLDDISTGTFPTTGVLDAFTRANGNLWTGNWATTGQAGTTPSIASNVVSPNGAGNGPWSYWNPGTFGPSSESYMTCPTLDSGGGAYSEFGMFVRLRQIGSGTTDGYVAAQGGLGLVARIDNGSETTLGADITNTLVAGDSLGCEVVGSVITHYYKVGAGAWTALGTRTDTTYTAAGNIGFYIYSNNGAIRLDNFGGGLLVTSIKTANGLARASVKTKQSLAIASVLRVNALT